MEKEAIERIEGLTNIKRDVKFLLRDGFMKRDIIAYVSKAKYLSKEEKNRIEGLSNLKEDIETLLDDGFTRHEIKNYVFHILR